ncbi:aminotransferase class IV [Rhodovibrionaceae bacterium A322]
MVKGTEVAQQEQQVHLSGRLVPRSQAAIAIDDRGFTLGDGLFETLAVQAGQALHLDRHLQRLKAGARQLALPLPDSLTTLKEQIDELLHANELGEGTLRITLSRGPGARGLAFPEQPTPTLVMTSTATPLSRTPRQRAAIVATSTRRNEHSPLSRLKSTGGYLDNMLALQEAKDKRAEEALLLNVQGNVTCGTIGNLFLLRDGDLSTPPVRDGVLPGIARQVILEEMQVEERSVTPEDLKAAEGLLLTNSLGVTLIRSLEGESCQTDAAAPVADKMLSLILT